MSNEEEEVEMELEFVEEEEIDKRLQKAVNRLIKSSKIDEEKLKGKTLEEQFDLLEFYMENLPKKTRKKNKPIVPLPTDIDAPKIGKRIIGVDGHPYYLFKPHEWLKRKK